MEKEKILQLTGGKALFDEPMSRHTTFRTGGPADAFVSPTAEELTDLLAYAKERGIPVTVLGNGSNVLVGDRGIRGLVISIGSNMAGISIEGNRVTAGAGALLSVIANRAADACLGGMEFAAGIPGSLGGAVLMNAGAYGGEMKDILTEVLVLESGRVEKLPLEALDLSYRHSSLMEREAIVLSAVLELGPAPEEEIRARMAELREKRQSKQPLDLPSAGSTFKRPEGYFAGALIEEAGLRGYSYGGAGVSEKHCGFVVNHSGATSAEVLQVIRDVQEKVYANSGVRLETEVRLIGEF